MTRSMGPDLQGSPPGARSLFWLSLCLLLCSFPLRALAQSEKPPVVQGAASGESSVPATGVSVGDQRTNPKAPGSVRGTVVDQTGAIIVGARVRLEPEAQSPTQEVASDADGQFSFTNVAPGTFRLAITAPGMVGQVVSGALRPGEDVVIPQVVLSLATQVTQITVAPEPVELAEIQIKEQEKQRVLGIVPNFYVSYIPNAVALTPKQKFELAWKSASDPLTLIGTGVLAGIDQAGDRWGAYGQGAQGYAKRYGASYANIFTATFIGGAIMPSILKQDPRYFYKGSGSKRSRILYALSSSVECKGDNGRWQPNYSNVIGSFAGAGLEVLYLPANDRRGSGFVVSSALIRLGETSFAGVLQEFVFPKFTPNRRTRTAPRDSAAEGN